jgi:calcineurin-like phosphoesterase family protein
MKLFHNYKNLFLTSDHHFYHDNIIEYSNRPFKNVLDMNETMINNWNSVVKQDSTVIYHGDFAFGRCTPHQIAEVVKALNGTIIFVEGNHDHTAVMKAHYKYNLFAEVHRDLDIRIITDAENKGDYIDIHCAHFPKLVWNRKHFGAWHSFGHCHSRNGIANQSIYQHDCGVDGNNYTPISVKQFGEIITKRVLEGFEWDKPEKNE